MKKLILLCALLIMSPLGAQNYSKKELVQMSVDRLFPNGAIKKVNADMSDIIKEWNMLFDAQNLKRDLSKHRSDWRKVFPIRKYRVHKIKGTRVYYGAIPKKYNYTIKEDAASNMLIINVKMHFYPSKKYLKRLGQGKEGYDSLEVLKELVAENVEDAELRWNLQAPESVRFEFEVVDRAEDADYSLKLVTFFGALYDKFITFPAYSDILSHEVGHMMGLDDEYSVITSNLLPVNELLEMTNKSKADRSMDYSAYKDMRCNLESIMCLRDTVYGYHIDHILGRISLRN
jgi:hypothetical protein